jgi:hypothetical protein
MAPKIHEKRNKKSQVTKIYRILVPDRNPLDSVTQEQWKSDDRNSRGKPNFPFHLS